jgi:hypothetical protein
VEALARSGAIEQAIVLARSSGDLINQLVDNLTFVEQLDLACAVAQSVDRSARGVYVLAKLARALLAAGQHAATTPLFDLMQSIVAEIDEQLLNVRAHRVGYVSDVDARKMALSDVSQALSLAGRLDEAYATLRRIDSEVYRSDALEAYAQAVGSIAADAETVLNCIHQAWLDATTRSELQVLFAMVKPLVTQQPELATALLEAYEWVDEFLKG